MKFFALSTIALALFAMGVEAVKSPKVSPYVDATRMKDNYLVDFHQKTGVNCVTLAFVLGGQGCIPTWGGMSPLDDAKIMGPIREFQKIGGKVIVATGGAVGPYLEQSCGTAAELAAAYKRTLEFIGTNHLDIDIEAPVDMNRISEALVMLQKEKPDTTVSFTLMVQGDDYGLTDELGTKVLKNLKDHGVVVDIVNPMTMEFWTQKPSYGDAVVAAADSVQRQMKAIWTEKSDAELYSMLGVTPMIGRNFNGKNFELSHARQLVEYAKEKQVGHLAFWSLGRDNGGCPAGGVSPDCSSVAQTEFEFSKIFNEYASANGNNNPTQGPGGEATTTTTTTTTTKRPDGPSTPAPTTPPTTTTKKPAVPTCGNGAQYVPHEDCDKFFICDGAVGIVQHCGAGTVWDPKINACNFADAAGRDDCKMP